MGVTIATTRVACATSTGTQTITTSDMGGLTPSAAIFICSEAVTDGTAADDAILSTGAATGASNEWCVVSTNEHGQGTTDCRDSWDDDRVVRINTPGTATVVSEAEFSSWTTNGVTINWTTNGGTAYLLTVILFGGTDLSAHANTLTLSTQNTEVDITDPGFEPDVIFFAGQVSDSGDFNGNTNDARCNLGCAINDGADTQRGLHWAAPNGQGTTLQAAYLDDNRVISTTGFYITGVRTEITNFDANGFSAYARDANGTNWRHGYLALNFNSVVTFDLFTYTTPTATGNDAESTPGFTPQFVMMGVSLAEAVDTAYENSNAGTIGLSCFDADDEYCTTITAEDNVATSNTQSLSDNVAVNVPDDDGTAEVVASFVSFDANGFTLNYSTAPATSKLFWCLAIEEEAAEEGRTTYNTDPYGLGMGRGLSRTYKQPGKGITA